MIPTGPSKIIFTCYIKTLVNINFQVFYSDFAGNLRALKPTKHRLCEQT